MRWIVMMSGLLLCGAASGQEISDSAPTAPDAAPTYAVIRSYAPEGFEPAIAQGQLVALPAGTPAAHALVDMVTEFVPAYGQATNFQPMNLGTGGMNSVLYQFRDQRSIVVMVHADQPAHLAGPHGCRIIANAAAGTPAPDQFAKIVHWCANAVVLSNLDPGAIVQQAR